MRVLVVSPRAARLGGAEIILWNILRHLDRDRVDPRLIFLEDGPFADEVRGLQMRADVIPAGRLRDPRQAVALQRSVARVIADERPDVVLNWSAKAHIYAAPACRLARSRPVVMWWQQMVPAGHWIDRAATALPADAVGAWSQAAMQAQRRLRPRRDTFVVHPGVPDPGRPTAGERNAARRRLAIPAERRVLVIVGRLQPWKRQDRFIAAVAALRAQGLDVHAIVVGGAAFGLSEDYAAGLAPLGERLGIGDRVLFTGQVDDVAPYLDCADVLVNASDVEPFGNVLIEAMAKAVPVIAVAAGGPAEIVVDGVSGILVPSSDSTVLAEALAGLVVDGDRRSAIGDGGRARFLEAFTAEAMAEGLTGRLEATVAASGSSGKSGGTTRRPLPRRGGRRSRRPSA